jgi:hypothetical protein
MMRMSLIAGLAVALFVAELRRAEAQVAPDAPPGPGSLQAAGQEPSGPGETVDPPINTTELDELLDAPEDDDEGDDLPGDIQPTMLTRLQDAAYGEVSVDELMVYDASARNERGVSLAPMLRNSAENVANKLRSIGIQPTVLDEARPATIRHHYARLRRGGQRPDVLIFYCICHGHSDPEQAPRGDRSHGHKMDLNNGRTPMWHASVRRQMLSVRPRRLAVILTEACSVVQQGALAGGGGELSPAAREILRSLFLGHTGVVDINSSSLGQSSICYTSGGLFSLCLFFTISHVRDRPVGAAADGAVSWSETFRATRRLVSDCSQGRQIPEEFGLARRR